MNADAAIGTVRGVVAPIGIRRSTFMQAIKAHFDGEKVVIPPGVDTPPPGEVIVIFQENGHGPSDGELWSRAQAQAFSQVWDNEEDAVYDDL